MFSNYSASLQIKMKLFAALLFFIASAYQICYGQVGESYQTADFGLSGPVKYVSVENYSAILNNGAIVTGELSSTAVGNSPKNQMQFDTTGHLKVLSYFDSDNMLNEYEVYQYDKKGNLSSLTSYNSDSTIYNRWIITYPGPREKIVQILDANNLISAKYDYNFDDSNRVVSVRREFYESDTIQLWSEQTASYYPGMKAIYGKSSDNDMPSFLYVYDRNRRLKDEIRIDNSINWRISFTYGSFDIPIKKVTYRNGIFTSERYKYEFDAHQNWIKKTIFINNIPKFIQIRSIKYYYLGHDLNSGDNNH